MFNISTVWLAFLLYSVGARLRNIFGIELFTDTVESEGFVASVL
jgi:hypothetical protein